VTSNENLSRRRFTLNNGSGEIPALGFGTSLSDNTKTRDAVKTAVEVGFRHLDAAERYRNEAEVGAALTELFARGTVRREDLFVTTKLWNNNHRPERVKPALQASLNRLGLDAVDLYLVHTPFAFKPGDDQDPRDIHGAVVYDDGVTLAETWAAMGTPRIARDRRDPPVGIRFAGACAGTAAARRPADRLDGFALWEDARASAAGVGNSARQRSPHGIGQSRAHSRELRRHRASGERDPRDQRAPRDAPPVQLSCGRGTTRICRGALGQVTRYSSKNTTFCSTGCRPTRIWFAGTPGRHSRSTCRTRS